MADIVPGAKIRNLAGAAAAAIARLTPERPTTISGVKSTDWPSALQPVLPIGPKGSEPMGMLVQMGQNLIFTPRPDAEYTAEELKRLATYPLARFCIENVKNLVADLKWQITAKQLPNETKATKQNREREDKNIPALTSLFSNPNPEQDWADWIRFVLEDLLVLDAPAIFLRKTGDGTLQELRTLPGESIVRYVDDNGYTPMAPDVAYAQLWEGIPRVNLTTDQLVYRPRNIVRRNTLSSQLYGMSATEQMADEIKIGMARLKFVLDYYTEGSTPGMMQVIPPGIEPEKVRETLNAFNSKYAGDLAARGQLKVVQGFNRDRPDQIIFTKETLLADAFDDLHIRKVCFGYGVSPQRLLRMMNRASSESNQEAAEEEGVGPIVGWVKRVVDYIIQVKIGLTGYEWTPSPDESLDEKTQSDIDMQDLKIGVRVGNECREARGLDPIDIPEMNMPGIITPTGWIPMSMEEQVKFAAAKAKVMPKPAAPVPPGKPDEKNTQDTPADAGSKKKLGKSSTTDLVLNPERTSHALATATSSLETTLKSFFKDARKSAGKVKLGTFAKLAKRDEPENVADIDAIVGRMMAGLSWNELADDVSPDLEDAAKDGAMYGILSLQNAGLIPVVASEVTRPGKHPVPALPSPTEGPHSPVARTQVFISEANAQAAAYAHDRAAELVGMKWDGDTLIENPDAQWAITDTTRTKLRSLVEDAFSRSSSKPELRANITSALEDADVFSDTRARMIAKTEVKFAQSGGNYTAWEKSGVVDGTRWITSGDHTVEDDCDLNADAGVIPLGQEYPTGDLYPPEHPACNCTAIASVKKLTQ